MWAKLHLTFFSLPQEVLVLPQEVLVLMKSYITGKQSYKLKQRANNMQCNAFWRCRLVCIITKCIEKFQTKAKKHNLEPLHSDCSLYTVAKYKTCKKGWCRRSEVCGPKTHVGSEDPYRPDRGHGYNQCCLYLSVSTKMVMDTATESWLLKESCCEKPSYSEHTRQSSLLQVSSACKKISHKVESLSLSSKKHRLKIG